MSLIFHHFIKQSLPSTSPLRGRGGWGIRWFENEFDGNAVHFLLNGEGINP